MARAGQTIENPVTGERITFVRTAADTGGALLELDDLWTRPGHRAAEHIHPEMEERWEVVSGAATIRVGGAEHIAGPGDVVVAPPGASHLAWNHTDGEVRLRVELRPALGWEDFVERLFALARDGGWDDPAALAALMRDFPREIALP